jgi:hypothetical protein
MSNAEIFKNNNELKVCESDLFLLVYYLSSPFNQEYLGITKMNSIYLLAQKLIDLRESKELLNSINNKQQRLIAKFYYYSDTYQNTYFINKLRSNKS